MEIFSGEKELPIHEKMKMKICRNDFDELGTILQIEFVPTVPSNHILVISFYDYNQIQLTQQQLLLLTNYESVFFDNVLFMSCLAAGKANTGPSQSYLIKLLNKEIYYVKLYIQTSNIKKNSQVETATCTNLVDVYNLELLDIKAMTHMKQKVSYMCNINNDLSLEKNEHLNAIVSELDKVNQSLMNEKELIEQNRAMLKQKEDQINAQIIAFKKDVMLYSDKFYAECSNKVNGRLTELQKKLQVVENNVMNKCRIIRERFIPEGKKGVSSSGNNIKGDKDGSSSGSASFRERIANLEIKNKLLEDTLTSIKAKLSEKEEFLKTAEENEEKMMKVIKKLKDEIVVLKSQLKTKEKEDTSEPRMMEIIDKDKEIPDKTMKGRNMKQQQHESKKMAVSVYNNKFEISKLQIQQFIDYFILDGVISSCMTDTDDTNTNTNYFTTFNEKELCIFPYLILHLAVNPISIFHKFGFTHICLLNKLSNYCVSDANSSALRNGLVDVIMRYPDLKKTLLDTSNSITMELNEKKNVCNVKELLNLNVILPISNDSSNVSMTAVNQSHIYINEILIQKSMNFQVYMEKNESKYVEKNNFAMFKLVTLSNLLLTLLLLKDFDQITQVLSIIYQKYICTKDHFAISFLLYRRYLELICLILKNDSLSAFISGYSSMSYNNNISTNLKAFVIFLDSFLFLYSHNYQVLDENFVDKLLCNSNILLLMKMFISNDSIISHKVIILISSLILKNPKAVAKLKVLSDEVKKLINTHGSSSEIIKLNLDTLSQLV